MSSAHTNGPRKGEIVPSTDVVGKSGLPKLASRLVTAYYQKDYDAILAYLTPDCLFIGAGSDVSYGARSLSRVIAANAAMPTFLVRDAEFHLVETNSPQEAVIVGFYTIYSDADHHMLASERQRLTINCRRQNGAWKAYLVHASNEWGPLDEGIAFPARVSRQTYRYVQDILRASRSRTDGSSESITLPVEGGTAFVNPAQIVYAEASAKKALLHLTDRTITVKLLLSNVIDLLPQQFTRVHRSYVVNRNHIVSLAGGEVVMSNGDHIPIPKRRRREIELELSRRTE